MQVKEGRGGSKGSLGSRGAEGPTPSGAVRRLLSSTSFASSISSTSLLGCLLLLTPFLSGCSRGVRTEPGVVNFLIETMPTNLDPRIGTDAQSERIDSLIFSSLLEVDEQRNVRAELADKWEMPDPLTYVFHLRSDLKFYDGRVLTSRT